MNDSRTNTLPAIFLLAASIFAAGCNSRNNPVAWIKRFTGPSASELGKRIAHQDPDVRREAIVALSEKDYGDDERILQYLVNALENDPEPSVRSAAARALGRAGNDQYAQPLAQALADTHQRVRWDVAVALDNVHGEEAAEKLIERLGRDESPDVRAASAHALRHYETLEVVRELVRALDDEAFNVQFQARASLVEITGYSYGYDSSRWHGVASGQEPLQSPGNTRPWWDWLGITDES